MPDTEDVIKKRGLFVCIDGGDGSGKTEQAARMVQRITADISSAVSVSFPDYDSPTGKVIDALLHGTYGDPLAFPPQVMSLYFAADRLARADALKAHLNAGVHVIANRYKAANDGHQGSKIADRAQLLRFFDWGNRLEFDLNGIPKPDINIILSVPVGVSLRLLAERAAKTGKPTDGHEGRAHLEAAQRTYAALAETSPDCVIVDCSTPDGQDILPINEIHERIWAIVRPLFNGQD